MLCQLHHDITPVYQCTFPLAPHAVLCCFVLCWGAAAEDGNGGYVITEQFVKDMLTEFKEQRLIHKRFAFQILLQVSS